MMLFTAGTAAGAQTTDHSDNFKKADIENASPPWEWADKDSTRAFQDTIEGVVKLFKITSLVLEWSTSATI